MVGLLKKTIIKEFQFKCFPTLNIKDNKSKFAVIGAGAAGITITNKLSSAGNSVALIEAGDYEISKESQNIYQGKVVGDPYFDLDVARLRHLGGPHHMSGTGMHKNPKFGVVNSDCKVFGTKSL